MAILSADYDELVDRLDPILRDFQPKIVAIDGKNGAGKSTLGRFLSWRFNSTLIETDLFKDEGWDYRTDELKRIVNYRVRFKKLPLIVEGIAILDILNRIEAAPDFHICVENIHPSDSMYDRSNPFFADRYSAYEKRHSPKKNADYILRLNYQV